MNESRYFEMLQAAAVKALNEKRSSFFFGGETLHISYCYMKSEHFDKGPRRRYIQLFTFDQNGNKKYKCFFEG